MFPNPVSGNTNSVNSIKKSAKDKGAGDTGNVSDSVGSQPTIADTLIQAKTSLDLLRDSHTALPASTLINEQHVAAFQKKISASVGMGLEAYDSTAVLSSPSATGPTTAPVTSSAETPSNTPTVFDGGSPVTDEWLDTRNQLFDDLRSDYQSQRGIAYNDRDGVAWRTTELLAKADFVTPTMPDQTLSWTPLLNTTVYPVPLSSWKRIPEL